MDERLRGEPITNEPITTTSTKVQNVTIVLNIGVRSRKT